LRIGRLINAVRTNSEPDAREILRLAGGYRQAVDAVLSVWRLLWRDAMDEKISAPEAESGRASVDTSALDTLTGPERAVAAHIVHQLTKIGLVRTDGAFSPQALHPLAVARKLLGGLRPDADLLYYLRRNLRDKWRCTLAPQTARFFHLLSSAANASPNSLVDKKPWYRLPALRLYLRDILVGDQMSEEEATRATALFLETCLVVRYLRLHYTRIDLVAFRSTDFDAEFLLANLFGLPTSINGFDELFGGGGLMFAEDPPEGGGVPFKGRTSLIIGRFGTGKSLLSLQLAVEVARKGGLAYVVPLEQSARECLYTLESMRLLQKDGSMDVATEWKRAAQLLARPERGALIILSGEKRGYEDFLSALKQSAAGARGYRLRLLIADPINSVVRGNQNSVAELRTQMMESLETIENAGTNVLFVAEEGTRESGELLFEQNIADTVMHLSLRERFGYVHRIFEITKSRLQREHRGEHPFSILPGSGVHIYPSPAAITARIRPRQVRPPENTDVFGLRSLDAVLGKDALAKGDVVVLQGASGSFKTPLGLIFLLYSDPREGEGDRRYCSLLVEARDDEETARHLLDDVVRKYTRTRTGQPNEKEVRICTLPKGHVHPGVIIQRIEEQFARARLDGFWIDRVMVDNVSHWELSCPFVQADMTFGDTLVNYLRRQRVSTLLVCGETAESSKSVLQRSIIDNADTCIQFQPIYYRGIHRTSIRIAKTRGVSFRREAFEIIFGPDGFSLQPYSDLLRVDPHGDVKPVNIRLFLYAETSMEHKYNEKTLEAARAVLSRETTIESQDRTQYRRALKLGTFSAVDEVQILQLDEFQLPPLRHSGRDATLFRFPDRWWGGAGPWGGFMERMRNRVRAGGTFFAVPYFVNVGLLAWRRTELLESSMHSWHSLAHACRDWESIHAAPELFFDFPRGTAENYNCFFLEILLSLQRPAEKIEGGRNPVLEWLQAGKFGEAARIFRQLGRRAHLLDRPSAFPAEDRSVTEAGARHGASGGEIELSSHAVVWRHWYTTLNQMMGGLPAADRAHISVGPLPGRVSIAGESYLGIPAYSAAPSVALEFIKLMTNREAELDRLHAGVGLPTRAAFYNDAAESEYTAIAPHFSMNMAELRTLVTGAFMRSRFATYARLSGLLHFHLQRILEIEEEEGPALDAKIEAILNELASGMSH
jgi:KaiC/GvpD/RAD55 family RecA-like ATPase